MGRAGHFRCLSDPAQILGAWQATFVIVKHVEPGEQGAIEGFDPDSDFLVEADRQSLPLVQGTFVLRRQVIEGDKDAAGITGFRPALHYGHQRPVPMFAGKSQAPIR